VTVPPQVEPPLLEMRGVGKDYRGVAALKASTSICGAARCTRSWERTGPASRRWSRSSPGAVTPNRGEIRLEGKRVEIAGPALARRYGIAMVYQETSLVPTMTVAQNLYLGTRSSSPP